MEENKKRYLSFTKIALQEIKCCKCGKIIKKNSLCQPIAALKLIDAVGDFRQYSNEDVLCEDCYTDYLIRSMGRLGISLVDENGQWRDFSDVIKQFHDIWKKYV